MHKDPVCGMDVDPKTAAGQSEYSFSYYFWLVFSCVFLAFSYMGYRLESSKKC